MKLPLHAEGRNRKAACSECIKAYNLPEFVRGGVLEDCNWCLSKIMVNYMDYYMCKYGGWRKNE